MMTLKHALLISLFALLIPSIATAELLDKTLVIVNNEVITQNELNSEFNRISQDFQQRGKRLPDNPRIRQQVLEKLIVKSVLLQQAARQNVVITERQTEQYLKRIAARNNLNLEQFRLALKTQGIEYSELYSEAKQNLTIQKLQQRAANNLAKVSDQEVKAVLEQSEINDDKEYHIAHILLPLPEAANPQQVTQQFEKAQELIKQLNNGANFNTLAQQHSSDQQALEGGNLGWRKKHELPTLFVEPVLNTTTGGYSSPIRSPSGFHIVHLIETKIADQVIAAQIKARHILIAPDALQTESEVIAKLDSLRDRILQGDDFANLARANSIDHISASKGGDLGWLNKGETVPEFEERMNALPINEISMPFQSPFGWHILQVTGHRNVDQTEESRINTIKNQLLTRKKQEAVDLWQKRLRDQAYVKFI